MPERCDPRDRGIADLRPGSNRGAVGSGAEIAARIAAYHEAGADHVAVVPSTAEDPAGRGLLEALTHKPVS